MDWKRQSLIALAACFGGWQNLAAQGVPGDKQPVAEDVFKNVQVLKGIPVSEFMATMGFFAASLGLNCVYCHVPESLQDWEKFADDVPRKRVARTMIEMVNAINENNFGGPRAITTATNVRRTFQAWPCSTERRKKIRTKSKFLHRP